MSDHQTPTADSRSARRRLLKGSFAVPAALTLASGTAFAAGSAGVHCVNDSSAVPEAPLPAPLGSDMLVRVRGYTTLTGGNAYTFVYGAEVSNKLGTSTGNLMVAADNGSLSSSNVLCVVGQTKGNPDFIKNNVYPVPISTVSGTSVYYAILINATGDIIGISSVSTAVGGAVSNNCWQSFGGMA